MIDPTSTVSTMTLVMQSVDVSTSAHVMNAMDVLGQVHAFYDSAWTKLVCIISVFGFIWPIVIVYLQNKSIKNTEDKINSAIEKHIADNKKLLSEQEKKLEEQLKKQEKSFVEKVIEQEKYIDKQIIKVQSFIAGAEALNYVIQKKFSEAFVVFKTAVYFNIKTQEIASIKQIVNIIKSTLDEHKTEIIRANCKENIKDILDLLNKSDIAKKELSAHIKFINDFYDSITN